MTLKPHTVLMPPLVRDDTTLLRAVTILTKQPQNTFRLDGFTDPIDGIWFALLTCDKNGDERAVGPRLGLTPTEQTSLAALVAAHNAHIESDFK